MKAAKSDEDEDGDSDRSAALKLSWCTFVLVGPSAVLPTVLNLADVESNDSRVSSLLQSNGNNAQKSSSSGSEKDSLFDDSASDHSAHSLMAREQRQRKSDRHKAAKSDEHDDSDHSAHSLMERARARASSANGEHSARSESDIEFELSDGDNGGSVESDANELMASQVRCTFC